MRPRTIASIVLVWGVSLAVAVAAGLYAALRSYSDMTGALGREATPPWGAAPAFALACLLATAICGVAFGIALTIIKTSEEEEA